MKITYLDRNKNCFLTLYLYLSFLSLVIPLREAFGVQLAVKPADTRFGDIPPSISDIPDKPDETRFGDIPLSISDIPDKSSDKSNFGFKVPIRQVFKTTPHAWFTCSAILKKKVGLLSS